MTTQTPKGWKTYDQFAYGIDTNRLPTTDILDGSLLDVHFEDGGRLSLTFAAGNVRWGASDGDAGHDRYDAVEVAPHTYFIEILYAARSRIADTLIVNTRTQRVLAVRSVVRSPEESTGEPQVAQVFRTGTIGAASDASGIVPAETRDLIGLRAHFTYSPNHVYEHVYLNSGRYCWQCLVGVQRGQGDVDLTTTYKFDENQYVFTFREFKIPVASTFFYNFEDMRSTGKFLGITGNGEIENRPAGAHIRKASMTFYLPGTDPA